MATKTEGRHTAEFLLSEASGARSRENVTIKSGAGKLVSGAILAAVLLGAATSAVKAGGNTGTGTLTLDATTPVLAGAKAGVYSVRCIAAATNAGTFRVEDPDGNVIGDVEVGATFADDIKFAIADGGTDFAVGDGFDITVAVGSKKMVAHNPSGLDGSQIASAVLYAAVDATSADAAGVAIVRDAEVKKDELTYNAATDDQTKKDAVNAALASVGIIVR